MICATENNKQSIFEYQKNDLKMIFPNTCCIFFHASHLIAISSMNCMHNRTMPGPYPAVPGT